MKQTPKDRMYEHIKLAKWWLRIDQIYAARTELNSAITVYEMEIKGIRAKELKKGDN